VTSPPATTYSDAHSADGLYLKHDLKRLDYLARRKHARFVSVPPAPASQRDDTSRRIVNPAAGMRGTILRTGTDTNGEVFEVEFLVEPGDWTGPDHIHLRQEERFEIVSGTLHLRVTGADEFLTPGSTRVVPPRTSHNLRNDGPEEARFLLQLRPALRMEAYLRDLWRAANAGSTRRWGAPSMLELAVIQREYPDEFFYLSRPSVRAQKTLLGALAVLGRAMGFRTGRDRST
jgi:mannose-6-phosphate isomerase-like protein (cupin superfamily)